MMKNINIIQSDLSALLNGLENTITEITTTSTLESLALFDSLVALRGNVQVQHDKVSNGIISHRTIKEPRFKPVLAISHEEFTKENVITAINSLQHPLFMRGEIAIRDAK